MLKRSAYAVNMFLFNDFNSFCLAFDWVVNGFEAVNHRMTATNILRLHSFVLNMMKKKQTKKLKIMKKIKALVVFFI